MGGFGSGRWDGSPVAEDALRLDLAQLISRGLVQPGRRSSGSLAWRSVPDGRLTAVITYAADLTDPADAWMDLCHEGDGARLPQDQLLRFVTTSPHHGGLRWWFLCPISGSRARILYLPPGAKRFASQRAHGLAYRSQRQSRGDRIATKAQAARRRLGIDEVDLLEMPSCPKPKGMRWRTYHRLRGNVEELRQALWATAPV
jgi:hypothetical protein